MSVFMALAHILALGHCSSIGTSCSFIWSSVMSWCCWLQDQLHSQNCILVSFFSHAGFSPWLLHVPHHDETTLSDLASLVPFCLHFLIFLWKLFLVPLLLSLAFALLCLPCLYQSLVGYFFLVKLLTRVWCSCWIQFLNFEPVSSSYSLYPFCLNYLPD